LIYGHFYDFGIFKNLVQFYSSLIASVITIDCSRSVFCPFVRYHPA